MKILNPHDKFVKDMLAEKDVAIAFLASYLPQEIASLLDLNSLEYSQTNFITPELQEFFSDVVFKVKMKNNEEMTYVSILLEHKSYPDNFTIFQVGLYLFNAYLNQKKQGQDLHLVVPIIYYNGEKNWQVKNINEIFGELPTPLLQYIPQFSYVYVDLLRMSEEEILDLQNGLLASSLLLQKMRHDPIALMQKIELIVNTLAPFQKRNFISKMMVYIFNVSEFQEMDLKDYVLKNEKISQDIKDEIMSTADLIRAEGIEKGIEKGIFQEREKVVCTVYKKTRNIDYVSEILSMTPNEIKAILVKYDLI